VLAPGVPSAGSPMAGMKLLFGLVGFAAAVITVVGFFTGAFTYPELMQKIRGAGAVGDANQPARPDANALAATRPASTQPDPNAPTTGRSATQPDATAPAAVPTRPATQAAERDVLSMLKTAGWWVARVLLVLAVPLLPVGIIAGVADWRDWDIDYEHVVSAACFVVYVLFLAGALAVVFPDFVVSRWLWGLMG
jgi:hypothetical protein